MVFAGDKVHAEPEEFTCVKKAAVSNLPERMGFSNKNAFKKALCSLSVQTNGSKFTGSKNETIIFDAVQKTIQLKDGTEIYSYNIDTGNLTLMEVPESYESYSEAQLRESLHSAILEDKLSKVQQILATGKININEPFYDGWTPLQVAVDFEKLIIVDYFLTFPDIDINGKGEIGVPPLYRAAQKGYVEIVQKLLNHGNIAINEPYDRDGSTPLFIAVQEKKSEIVQMLLNTKKVDINKPSLRGVTPLAIALRQNNLFAMKLLIDNHADLNIPDKEGFCLLDRAVQWENIKAVELILNAGLDQIDINRRHPDGGCTPLHEAILMNRSDEIALKLIELGADLTVKSDGGFTPFFAAVQKGKIKLMEVLSEKDKHAINEPNDQRYTPINFAAENGLFEIVNKLIQLDANPNIPDEYGFTPLFHAVRKKHFEVAKTLVNTYKSKIELDVPTKEGFTPLMFAIASRYNDSAKFLIDAGSNINGVMEINKEMDAAGNNFIKTPFRVAIREENVPMIEFILSHRDFHFTYDLRGISIELFQAIYVNNPKIVAALLKSEKIHITDSALDFTSDEKIKTLLRKKLESINPTEEEEGSEQKWEEEEEPEPETAPEDVQLPQSNPLPDQAEMSLAPASPVRRSRDDYLLEMVTPLEQQVREWRRLNRLLNRRTTPPCPLCVDVHTRNAVRPKVYIETILNGLRDLLVLDGEDYTDVEVILITGRGRHSMQRGFPRLQEAVHRIAAEERFDVRISTNDPGRLLLNFRSGRFI
jgi:ankyrin repeat protein